MILGGRSSENISAARTPPVENAGTDAWSLPCLISRVRAGWEHGAPIDLLLVDVVLRRRSGDLIARLRDRDPSLPVLLISGRDAADPEVQRLLGAATTRHVQKPFHVEALLAEVQALVSAR